jgi:hypothetical protein
MVGTHWNVVSLPVAVSKTLSTQAVAGQLARGGGTQGAVPPESSFNNYSNVSGLHAQIRQVKDGLMEAAQMLRQANTGLVLADELLGDIKINLTEIVKQYPPLAHDAPQRVAYLNAITGLRKQLEALSFPPDRAVSAESGVALGRGMDWLATTPPVPTVPSEGDLAIPELDPATATDKQIEEALGVVTAVQDHIAALRENMWGDVLNFVGNVDAQKTQSLIGMVTAFLSTSREQGVSGDGYKLSAQGI